MNTHEKSWIGTLGKLPLALERLAGSIAGITSTSLAGLITLLDRASKALAVLIQRVATYLGRLARASLLILINLFKLGLFYVPALSLSLHYYDTRLVIWLVLAIAWAAVITSVFLWHSKPRDQLKLEIRRDIGPHWPWYITAGVLLITLMFQLRPYLARLIAAGTEAPISTTDRPLEVAQPFGKDRKRAVAQKVESRHDVTIPKSGNGTQAASEHRRSRSRSPTVLPNITQQRAEAADALPPGGASPDNNRERAPGKRQISSDSIQAEFEQGRPSTSHRKEDYVAASQLDLIDNISLHMEDDQEVVEKLITREKRKRSDALIGEIEPLLRYINIFSKEDFRTAYVGSDYVLDSEEFRSGFDRMGAFKKEVASSEEDFLRLKLLSAQGEYELIMPLLVTLSRNVGDLQLTLIRFKITRALWDVRHIDHIGFTLAYREDGRFTGRDARLSGEQRKRFEEAAGALIQIYGHETLQNERVDYGEERTRLIQLLSDIDAHRPPSNTH